MKNSGLFRFGRPICVGALLLLLAWVVNEARRPKPIAASVFVLAGVLAAAVGATVSWKHREESSGNMAPNADVWLAAYVYPVALFVPGYFWIVRGGLHSRGGFAGLLMLFLAPGAVALVVVANKALVVRRNSAATTMGLAVATACWGISFLLFRCLKGLM